MTFFTKRFWSVYHNFMIWVGSSVSCSQNLIPQSIYIYVCIYIFFLFSFYFSKTLHHRYKDRDSTMLLVGGGKDDWSIQKLTLFL